MQKEKGIWIIQESDASKSTSDWGADYEDSAESNRNGFVSASQLRENVAEFLEVMTEAFNQAENVTNQPENAEKGIRLSELECSIEINGKGQIGLFGIGGGEAGAKGAIKLKFTRKDG